MTAAERAIQRIRDEMHARNITQRDLADRMRCSQGRIAKILKGQVELRLNDIEELARLVGITLVEAIRDRGLEFYAELTPTEVRMLEWLRQHPNQMRGVLHFADIVHINEPMPPATGTKKRAGRPLNSAKGDDRVA